MKVRLTGVLTMVALAVGAFGCGQPQNRDPDGGPGADADAGGGDAGAPDTDIAVVQLNANGTLDTSFGTGGTAVLDLSTGSSLDTVYSIAKDSQDRVVLFGTARGEGSRTDPDRVVVRLTQTGARDATFAGGGLYRLNVGDAADNARGGLVQSDGKIFSGGYMDKATGVGSQEAEHVVLARLNADGTADTSFGSNGVLINNPFSSTAGEWGAAEAYGVSQQSTGKYVTVGYGRRAPSGTADVVSFRYLATGALDTTFADNGVAVFDMGLGDDDKGRGIAVLPDNRLFVVGSGITTAGNGNALAMLLTADGALDPSFSTDGKELYDFGRATDAFYGAAATANHLIAVGFSAGATIGGGAEDEDSAIFIHPLTGGTTISRKVPLSDTANDRLWSVALDGSGKIVAAGFIDEGGDTQIAVARFNLDGTFDTTFGTGGIVKVNAKQGGKVETARAVVVLSNGKIAVAANIER